MVNLATGFLLLRHSYYTFTKKGKYLRVHSPCSDYEERQLSGVFYRCPPVRPQREDKKQPWWSQHSSERVEERITEVPCRLTSSILGAGTAMDNVSIVAAFGCHTDGAFPASTSIVVCANEEVVLTREQPVPCVPATPREKYLMQLGPRQRHQPMAWSSAGRIGRRKTMRKEDRSGGVLTQVTKASTIIRHILGSPPFSCGTVLLPFRE